MSMWTDREVKKLIDAAAALRRDVTALENRVAALESDKDNSTAIPHIDKRSKEWRDKWKNTNSSQ
jgi:hypothetical protein